MTLLRTTYYVLVKVQWYQKGTKVPMEVPQSVVIPMSEEVQLKVRIPSDLKKLVDTHTDYNKELVEKAIRNQLSATGKTALDLRIEQKEERIQLIDEEIAALEEEREGYVEDLNNLLQQKSEHRDERYEVVEEAVEMFGGDDLGEAQAEHWADKADLPVDEFKEAYNEVRSDE